MRGCLQVIGSEEEADESDESEGKYREIALQCIPGGLQPGGSSGVVWGRRGVAWGLD